MESKLFLFSVLLAFVLVSCNDRNGPDHQSRNVVFNFQDAPVRLDDYWYQGKAEISRYELSQNRYRDVHPGEAILIFVTEDFLTDKQVKNERYREGANSTPVLKTNLLRKFTTGFYDYSIMTSVFTPTEVDKYPATLKLSTSSQEWCGQTFMQVNLRNQEYQVQVHSYFEAEADATATTPLAPMEEELFNRIRINPQSLPTGNFELLPSTVYCRLQHKDFRPYPVEATLVPYAGQAFSGELLKAYRLTYPDLQRTVEIVFEDVAPFRIEGWTESYPSAFDGQMRTTTARRTHTTLDDYWNHNALEDQPMRRELGIEYLQ